MIDGRPWPGWAAPDPTTRTSAVSVARPPDDTAADPPRSGNSCGRGRSLAIVRPARTEVSLVATLPGAEIENAPVTGMPAEPGASESATLNVNSSSLDEWPGRDAGTAPAAAVRSSSQRIVIAPPHRQPAADAEPAARAGSTGFGRPSRLVTRSRRRPAGACTVSTTGRPSVVGSWPLLVTSTKNGASAPATLSPVAARTSSLTLGRADPVADLGSDATPSGAPLDPDCSFTPGSSVTGLTSGTNARWSSALAAPSHAPMRIRLATSSRTAIPMWDAWRSRLTISFTDLTLTPSVSSCSAPGKLGTRSHGGRLAPEDRDLRPRPRTAWRSSDRPEA